MGGRRNEESVAQLVCGFALAGLLAACGSESNPSEPDSSRKPEVKKIAVGNRPLAVAVVDGVVWTSNLGGHSLTAVDAATETPLGEVELEGMGPSALAAGDGEL